jgi:hypothetical protein
VSDEPGAKFTSPEQAAEATGWGVSPAITVSHSPDGRYALVLLPDRPEVVDLRLVPERFREHLPEESEDTTSVVLCERRGGRWRAISGGSGSGPGWLSTSLGVGERHESLDAALRENRGVLHVAGRVPDDAAEIVVRWRAEEHRVPVVAGWFLFAAWDVPAEGWMADGAVAVRYVGRDGSEQPLPDAAEDEAALALLREQLDEEATFGSDWPYARIEAIEPLEALTEAQRELLDSLIESHPEFRGQRLAVYRLKHGPSRRPAPTVAPADGKLTVGDHVLTGGGWSTVMQTVTFIDSAEDAASAELGAVPRLIRYDEFPASGE